MLQNSRFHRLSAIAICLSGCGADLSGAASQPEPAPPDLALAMLCPGRPEPDPPPGGPTDPMAWGRLEVDVALAEIGCGPAVDVVLASAPGAEAALAAAGVRVDAADGSFAIVAGGRGTLVVGSDPVGALYGAYELAERLRIEGPQALPPAGPITGTPAVPIRAANLFLVLPEIGERDWWFHDTGFWSEYLDLLMRSRINVLDLHGMYSLENTMFPNALLFFASSGSFPQVGAPRADRERNLAMLVTVIEMASSRGIRVSLMSYQAGAALDGAHDDWTLDSNQLKAYTREAVADLAARAPGLWRLGFRIGESGQPAQWYVDSFVAGLKDSGSAARPYTRTWYTSKSDILRLIEQGGGEYIVQSKLNGEQLGPPYAIAGGAFVEQGWTNYSYQDYLEAPAPYEFVFQVRTGGTHRIFRYASYERTRRLIDSLHMGIARGFTVEPAHAYYPQRDFYHAPADRFSAWTFHRDELQYLLFGRLGYDPRTPERPFRRWVEKHAGTGELWEAIQAAGEIVPWIQTANTCGPDSRDFAPELELGGTTASWARPPGPINETNGCGRYHGPFDSFAVAAPTEFADDYIRGRPTARLSPLEVARRVASAAAVARSATAVTVDPDNREARDLVRECRALADLGDYWSHKMRSATALAVYQRTGRPDYLEAARAENVAASSGWTQLAADTAYIAPFSEWLRMGQLGLGTFHWRSEVPRLASDGASIESVAQAISRSAPYWPVVVPLSAQMLEMARPDPPALVAIEADPPDPAASLWTVTARFAVPLRPGTFVTLLWKPFSGEASWSRLQMTGAADDGASYTALLAGQGGGAMFAVEVNTGTAAWRLPDVTSATPYVSLAPRAP